MVCGWIRSLYYRLKWTIVVRYILHIFADGANLTTNDLAVIQHSSTHSWKEGKNSIDRKLTEEIASTSPYITQPLNKSPNLSSRFKFNN